MGFDPSSIFSQATGGFFGLIQQRAQHDHERQVLVDKQQIDERKHRIEKDGWQKVEEQDYERANQLFVHKAPKGGFFGGEETLFMRGPHRILCESDGTSIMGAYGEIYMNRASNVRGVNKLIRDYGRRGLQWFVELDD